MPIVIKYQASNKKYIFRLILKFAIYLEYPFFITWIYEQMHVIAYPIQLTLDIILFILLSSDLLIPAIRLPPCLLISLPVSVAFIDETKSSVLVSIPDQFLSVNSGVWKQYAKDRNN